MKFPLTVLAWPMVCHAQRYALTDTYNQANFFSKFNFYTGPDPTNGFVTYVDYDTAVKTRLIPVPGIANWAVDSTTILPPSGIGRNSIRLESKALFNKNTLLLIDLQHAPGSICSVWPAMWLLGRGPNSWPAYGELDILEGVNTARVNSITAHTSDNCSVTGGGQTAILQGSNCAVSAGTAGCGSQDQRPTSYGTGFNDNGGGVFAIDWTSNAISVWFFPRNAIPPSVIQGSPTPSKDFGTPTAVFGPPCDTSSKFTNMALIFDTTFCGDWAGNTFTGQGCPSISGQSSWSSCVIYAAANTGVFAQAYWYVNYIKVYSNLGGSATRLAAGVPKPVGLDAVTAFQVPLGRNSSVKKT